ncbi:hypothetical protein Aros01_09422 [Streptosporangium roseum]
MAFEQPGGGALQGGDVQRAVEVEGDLGGVDVVLVVEGVEEQALLQRREWEDVLDLRHRFSHAAWMRSISFWSRSTRRSLGV